MITGTGNVPRVPYPDVAIVITVSRENNDALHYFWNIIQSIPTYHVVQYYE